VVTGWAPTKGIALPLVSAGGTGWVLTAFSLGLLVSMGREAEQADDRPVPAVCVDPPAGRGRPRKNEDAPPAGRGRPRKK
jgi:hypothetical protein